MTDARLRRTPPRSRNPLAGSTDAAGRSSSSRSSSLAIVYPLVYRSLERGRAMVPVAGHRGPHRLRDVRDPGPRPEHRHGLRGPARPGLCRLLRHRRVHDGLPRIEPLRASTSAGGSWSGSRSAVAATFGVLLGAPTLKLRGDYLAIVTLGFGEIVPIVFRNLGDFTLALPAFLGGAVIIGPNANLTGGNVGHQPDRPTDHSDRRAVGRIDRVLEPEPDCVLVSRPCPAGGLRSSSAAACATRSSAAPGWRSARTRPPPPRWASTRSRPSCWRSRWAPSFSGSPARSRCLPTRAIFAETFSFNVSILVVIIIILGGIGVLRGVVIGAFAAAVRRPDPRCRGSVPASSTPRCSNHRRSRQDRDPAPTSTWRPTTTCSSGSSSLVMMVRRPEGLFPAGPPRPRCTASASPPR